MKPWENNTLIFFFCTKVTDILDIGVGDTIPFTFDIIRYVD